jgi:hypothetical protein
MPSTVPPVFDTNIEDLWEPEAPAEAIEDIWESDKHSTAEMRSPSIDEVWESDHNQENPSEDIEDLWEPASEEEKNQENTAEDIEDLWEPASEQENNQENPAEDIEDLWDPASEQENSEADSEINSSVPTANSQLMVSPSRITIPVGNRPFLLSDVWPDLDTEVPTNAPNSSLDTPAQIPFRRFGPEDFPHLQDHMFEDANSDSESDGLYD